MWMAKRAKVIFHVDMNSFYASVEVAYNPKLKGKPVAIAGNPEERKGIIVTSSYEARAKGVKTTMPLWEAKKLCPELIVLRPNFPRYRKTSSKIFRMLAEVTPMTEPVSIDEGYMDVTDHPTHPVKLAKEIQHRLLTQLNIPCSIGIGPNKFLA
ncbi:MAG TPA: DNA polymerase IV, partial [Pseudogracilibacillus sp.]|nr:DNA polymerase IV [Pseudogracilibacillus sp.]